MRDYLTNILDRSFGVEPAIRPRVASLFEPARIDLPAFAEEVETETPVGEEAARPRRIEIESTKGLDGPHAPLRVEERARVPAPLQPNLSPNAIRVDRTTARDDQPSATPPQRPAPTPLIKDGDQGKPAHTRVVVERTVERITERQQPSHEHSLAKTPTTPVAQSDLRQVVKKNLEPSVPTSEKVLVQPRLPSPPAVETKRAADPNARALPTQTEPSSPRVSAENAEVKSRVATPSTSKKEIEVRETKVLSNVSPPATTKPSAAKVVHPTSVAPVWLPPAKEPDEAKQSAASEPTIQVTIGRVEVRAVSGETPKSQRPKPSDLMSLDDYLRQRARGAKR